MGRRPFGAREQGHVDPGQPGDRDQVVGNALAVQPLLEQLARRAGGEAERKRGLAQAPDHPGDVDALPRRVDRGVPVAGAAAKLEGVDPDRVIERRVRGDSQDHPGMVPESGLEYS
jgi:hypothetical protein